MTGNLTLSGAGPYVTWSRGMVSFDPASNGGWLALRLNVDGRADAHGSHANPANNSEDTMTGLHRIDWLSGGVHQFRAEWGEGSGTPYSNGTDVHWTRRLGVLAIPAQ